MFRKLGLSPQSLTNRRWSVIPFVSGILFGAMMSFIVFSPRDPRLVWNSYNWGGEIAFDEVIPPCQPVSGDQNHLKIPHDGHEDSAGPDQHVGSHSDAHDEAHAYENHTIQEELFDKVRVLCWIMTNPGNHEKKSIHVKRTWGSRCNKLIFMSTQNDSELGAVALPVKEGRGNLWAKTKEAFRYIHQHHMDDADWFFKADDDTYVIVENLRFMLAPYSPDHPIYFGCHFKPYVKQGYMSGGAGYVLSKESVRRLVEQGLPDAKKCDPGVSGMAGSEDVEMGHCLENVGVLPGDSRAPNGRHRFLPLPMDHVLIPGAMKPSFWFWSYIFFKLKEGFECCADNAISFHYISPNWMYVLDYLIYHLRPYGIVFQPQPIPEKLSFAEVVEDYNQKMAAMKLPLYTIRNDSKTSP